MSPLIFVRLFVAKNKYYIPFATLKVTRRFKLCLSLAVCDKRKDFAADRV